MTAQGAVGAPGRAPAPMPYRSSWVDGLLHAIGRLPAPAWVFYVALLAGVALFINATIWIAGQGPPGSFRPTETGYAVYGVYMLALMHYLNGVADAKIESLRPALGLDAEEFERLRYELTNLPARQAALAGITGVMVAVGLLASDPPNAGAGPPNLAVLVGRILVDGSTLALLAVLIYHTYHQLRLVSRIHARASQIDLFEPAPLYAFSQLTARTGAGLVVLLAYSYLLDASINVVGVTLTGVVLTAAAAAFVLPLRGMHERIVHERQLLQTQADRRFKATLADLHRSVDERDLSVADALNKTLASLQLERDALAKIPTWPWEASTLRAFVSALFVPIVLWLIIRGLERIV